MVLSVVSNISSLTAQRNLSVASDALSKSLERLSTGSRINRAGDDAAGLAISEGLRSQIRGINQAVRNANDGLSLIGTAEAAIGSYTENLQRIRELSVQSANDTNSAANRAALDKEVQQLLTENQRISETIEFNGLKLLDGSFTERKLQVGAQANQWIGITTGNLSTNKVGQVAKVTGLGVSAGLGTAYTGGNLVVNGVDIVTAAGGTIADDGVSFSDGAQSAIALAKAINISTAEHGVRAEAGPAVVTAGTGILAATIGANEFKINGVDIAGDGAISFLADDTNNALVNAINRLSNSTGVVATKDATNHLVLTAADGRNIDLDIDGSVSDAAFNLGLGATTTSVASNTGGTLILTSLEDFDVAGTRATDAGLANTTYTQDPTTAINTIIISSTDGARRAIDIIDFALEETNGMRSNLGAITNRLQQTIGSLQTISENLSASDSRIRDADFASETASLTRNQILQQAGIAILAQANQTTQGALSLLKG